ncbi:sarcosine oxidase subunit gamma family protein [Ensifer adhaerens]|uniref:sarcosine oxidase subunit gamma family protein n=1 Tax=Ensifer adhaerens TaxID=106592 RepID=UPI001CBAF030|nr:sarcosine oxidase subunit gamma family protein [Ensifer adhaerens]MBZ7926031.1 sarcosine oxidase subunit gamma family protein [Ensifer adhaerens]UAX94820.1 sarcosine oxidase subunit gamma family protein [Ensifer adhaerens]UAY03289.1 sarcosine oxidase subunit gamma family protein [Ensifer adhaerens]UAY11274.1 sarcosine oxidase subunit gamma family protein [Ensifer adhaerens]
MLDNSRKWKPEPDWNSACLTGRAVDVRAVSGLTQHLVSGDIERFRERHGLAKDIGALGLATGERYAVRVARDRLLVVGLQASECAAGWHQDGYGVTALGSAQRVFEARGEGVRDLLARATTIDPDNAGPCAALQFCGLTCSVYFHGDTQALRVHVDRGLAAYLWEWLECQPLFCEKTGGFENEDFVLEECTA